MPGCRKPQNMSIADLDESWFPFLRRGTPEAAMIGSWARAAFLPPETFQALLSSLIGEWLEAGSDPSAATAARGTALAAYRGEEASSKGAETEHDYRSDRPRIA
jgi:hypothetical protein